MGNLDFLTDRRFWIVLIAVFLFLTLIFLLFTGVIPTELKSKPIVLTSGRTITECQENINGLLEQTKNSQTTFVDCRCDSNTEESDINKYLGTCRQKIF